MEEVRRKLDELTAKYARGTFGGHLEQANKMGLLEANDIIVCEEVNESRSRFLYWEPGRFRVPTYQGELITTDAGFLRCLTDIDKMIVRMKENIDRA